MITTDVKAQKAEPKKYALAISDHYGKMEDSNDRVVNQLIVKDVLERVKNGGTNQLQMGLTELAPGSVWNTMPATLTLAVWKHTSTSMLKKATLSAT